ncbi:UNKNOWN [Stylonychia lemnae]|uniref:Uncharacterized protein n=1 Tax=Stylonychia lemnae TaxID=5949 RepID=A0A078B7B3_STYLE|nr:UNKNOWN [Stylonychia lemnae]|eukprot:CDW90096.1 UNKNOWN [Stylonychia lemnae]
MQRKNNRGGGIKALSTDSETPPQLYVHEGGRAPLGPGDKITMEVEYYDVIYTRHLQQKQKTWEDGFMEYHLKNSKVKINLIKSSFYLQLVLFARSCRANQLDNKFFKQIPDLSPGEEFKLNKYIVNIENRRMEGKISVKRESQLEARKSKKALVKAEEENKSPILIKGAKTGSVGKGLPTALNAGPKKLVMGFPRKQFVCPQKVKDEPKDSDDEDCARGRGNNNSNIRSSEEIENQRLIQLERKTEQLRKAKEKANAMRNDIFQNAQPKNQFNDLRMSQEENSGNHDFDNYMRDIAQKRKERQIQQEIDARNNSGQINLQKIKQMQEQIIKNDLDIFQSSDEQNSQCIKKEHPEESNNVINSSNINDGAQQVVFPQWLLQNQEIEDPELKIKIENNIDDGEGVPENQDSNTNQKAMLKSSKQKDISDIIKSAAQRSGYDLPKIGMINPKEHEEFEKEYLKHLRIDQPDLPVVKRDDIHDQFQFEASEEEDDPNGQENVDQTSTINSKKRKLDEISNELGQEGNQQHHDYNKFKSNAVEKQISSPMKKRLLTDQIQKQNALERLKEMQEKKISEINQQIKSFGEAMIDFSVRHPIYQFPREGVFQNRESYAGFFILAVIEMLKYAIKEDYENQRTEMQLIPIILEYTKPSQSHRGVLQNANFKNLKKRIQQRKKNERNRWKGKGGDLAKRGGPESQDDEESKSEDEGANSGDESDGETPGAFYIKFKDKLPPLVKKDMMVEDLWILMKRPMITNQNLNDVSDILFVKGLWHSHNAQLKIKVSIIGAIEEVRYKADQYKFAFKSVNLNGFSSLIENLIEFRERSNPYVDSMLSIKNSRAKFKVLKKCDLELVEAVRQATCIEFKLNRDQECVLNEVTKWYLARSKTKNNQEPIDEQVQMIETKEQDPKAEDSNVILVHGAFGCGKSYLLVAIIRFICTLLDIIGDKEIKILVCALTNIAVDRILLMLKNSGYEDFARVGSLKKINKHLLRYTHHSASNKKQADKEALKELEAMIEEIKASVPPGEILKQKRVVGATCASTGFEVMKNMQFKIVILDECSQMLEPQSLLPISRFNCRKLIAVGDPLQLPPIISFNFKEKKMQQQQILEESKNKARTQNVLPHLPLFVRLMKEQFYCILLRTQYRCHPMIAQIANDLFYENYLENGVRANARKQLIKEFQPVTFISAEKGQVFTQINAHHQCQESKSEFSYRNYYEARFIVALLDYLCCLICQRYSGKQANGYESSSSSEDDENNEGLNDGQADDVPDFSIGVIVTYKSQEELINQMIIDSRNEALKAIQVSTVDAFQGAERDIIIVGCVRTRNLGFIEDCRRLNVAITRARRHLIVVGKETLLTRNCHWRYIIEKAKNKTDKVYGYKNVDDFITKGGLFKHMLKDFQ